MKLALPILFTLLAVAGPFVAVADDLVRVSSAASTENASEREGTLSLVLPPAAPLESDPNEVLSARRRAIVERPSGLRIGGDRRRDLIVGPSFGEGKKSVMVNVAVTW